MGAGLRAVADVAQAILDGADVDETFRRVAREARLLVGAQTSVVGTLVEGDREGGADGESDMGKEGEGNVKGAWLRVRAVEGPPASRVRPGMVVPVARTLAAEALRTGRRSVFADATRARSVSFRETARAMGLGPVIAVPLAARGRVFGALGVANPAGERPFAGADARLVEAFAAQAAVALELGRAREELQRLAVVQERERIARELHDGVIQTLFGIGMGLQALTGPQGVHGPPGAHESQGSRVGAEGDLPEAARASLASAVDGIDGAIRDLRNYIFGLRPGLLADRQLGQAIRDLAHALGERSGVAVSVEIDPLAAALLAPAAAEVVQIVREALSNVARHAHATLCLVRLGHDGRVACLEVADDGRGFDQETGTGQAGQAGQAGQGG